MGEEGCFNLKNVVKFDITMDLAYLKFHGCNPIYLTNTFKVSMWLLYILSYSNSFQLYLMMVILHFICNFDMVVGGEEHSVYLLCHLDLV